MNDYQTGMRNVKCLYMLPMCIYAMYVKNVSCIAADNKTTIDPDDIIDEGWWVSEVNEQRELFPANYMELM